MTGLTSIRSIAWALAAGMLVALLLAGALGADKTWWALAGVAALALVASIASFGMHPARGDADRAAVWPGRSGCFSRNSDGT